MISQKFIRDNAQFGIICKRGSILAKFYLVSRVKCFCDFVDGGEKEVFLQTPLKLKRVPKNIRDIVGKLFNYEEMQKFFPAETSELLVKSFYLIEGTLEKKTLNNLAFKDLYELSKKTKRKKA